MRGATASVAGSRGIVPKPTAGQHNFMLLGDGTWGAQPVAGLPSQTSNSGKLLTTDGTNASWTTTGVLTSLTSPAATPLTLGTGSFGTALTVASATGDVSIASTTAGSSGVGALVVAGGISGGNTGAASYFGGGLTVGGAIYSSSFLDATGGVGTPVSGHGQFSGSGTYGAVIAGYGSTYDFALFNRSGVDVLHVATNTTTVAFSGAATFAGDVITTGKIGATSGDSSVTTIQAGSSSGVKSSILLRDSWNGTNNNNAYFAVQLGNGSASADALRIDYLKNATFAGAVTANGVLSVVATNGSGAQTSKIQGGTSSGDYGILSFQSGSTVSGRIVANASATSFRFDTGGTTNTIDFLTGTGYTTALSISGTTQAATFAGTVSANSGIYPYTAGNGSGLITQNGAAGGLYFANQGISTNMRFLVTDGAAASVLALTLSAGTGAATFAGAVTVGGNIVGSGTANTFAGANGSILLGSAFGQNLVSLNNSTSATAMIGVFGGGVADPSMYYAAPTGGTHDMRINNASKLVLSATTATFSGAVAINGATVSSSLDARVFSAVTNTTVRAATFSSSTSGTPTDGFGGQIELLAKDLAGNEGGMGSLRWAVKNTGYSNREGEVSLWTYSNAAAYRQLTLSPGNGAAGASTFAGAVTIGGNLTVNGTTTTVNSTTVTVDDPIITLGGDTAPTVDDNKDRGVEFKWHNGTIAKAGFFGFDDSTGYLTFIPDATNTSEVFSGTLGDIQATNFRGNLIGNVTGNVTGNVSGNVSGSAGSVAILTAGGYLTGTSFNGSAAVTFAVDATSANTVSKVVARDASGNFSAGTITGTRLEARNSGTAQVYLDSTTSGSKEIVFQNNGVVAGYVWASGGYVGVGSGGTTSLFVTTASGNVGVGTVAPGAKLEVASTNNTETVRMSLSTDLGFRNSFYNYFDGASPGLNWMALKVASAANTQTEVMRLLGDGKVGIGTTSPSYKLDVAGGVKIGGEETLPSAIGSMYLSYNSAINRIYYGDGTGYDLRFSKRGASATTDFVTFKDTGYVGIGTTAPAAKLEIAHDGASTYGTALHIKTTAGTDGPRAAFEYYNGGSPKRWNVGIRNSATSFGIFEDGSYGAFGTERLTILAGGNVGIGTTSPGAKFEIKDGDIWLNGATGASNPEIRFIDDGGISVAGAKIRYGNGDGNLYIEHVWDNAASGIFFKNRTAGTSLNTLSLVNGNVGIGTTSPGAKLHIKQGGDFDGSGGSLLHVGTSVITNTSDLGVMVSVSDATTAAPQKAGVVLYNNDATAGGWSPMLLFAKKESGATPYQATMAGIAAKSPLGTGNGDGWIDGELHFYTAGAATTGLAARMVIDKNGNLGTGTTSPVGNLDVTTSGTGGWSKFVVTSSSLWGDGSTQFVTIGAGSGVTGIMINNPHVVWNAGNAGAAIRMGKSGGVSGGAYYDIGTRASDAWSIQKNASETGLFFINSAGNVGIGTTSPGAKLHVAGNAIINDLQINTAVGGGPASTFTFQSNTASGVNDGFVFNSSRNGGSYGNFEIQKTGTAKVHIGLGSLDPNTYFNIDGNFGIGVTSPAYKLDVAGAANAIAAKIGAASQYLTIGSYTPTSAGVTLGYNTTQYLGLNAFFGVLVGRTYVSNNSTAPADGMAIQGNVGIGTTGPVGKLEVVTTSDTAGTPSAYDNKYFTVGTGGATGGSVFISYDQTNNRGYIGALSPSVSWRNLILQGGGGNVGIGTITPGYKLEVNGSFAATTKSFVIKHPTKEGKKLRYGSLEGPENGIYIRGKTTSKVIELPDYWTKLVDPDSISVQLTSIGSHQKLYVEKIENNKVYISNENLLAKSINCFFYILAERADVEKLQVEIDG